MEKEQKRLLVGKSFWRVELKPRAFDATPLHSLYVHYVRQVCYVQHQRKYSTANKFSWGTLKHYLRVV